MQRQRGEIQNPVVAIIIVRGLRSTYLTISDVPGAVFTLFKS